MGSDPPYVAFGSTGVKDSLQNLREVPEFVANIVTMGAVAVCVGI
jgi:flavin reductase (DIM6/NTAB) family NADH-FMN oxidoreductase RutF